MGRTILLAPLAAGLGFVAGVLLVIQSSFGHAGHQTALLVREPSDGQQLFRVSQLEEETPFWMGFRSSIDGYNVHQSPNTFPGGAQDQQEPVPYPYPWANSNNAGGVGEQTTSQGGGGVNVQGKAKGRQIVLAARRDERRGALVAGVPLMALEESYPFSPPAAFDSDPKHGFGGYGGGTNAGAYEANPGGSYYCADCTW